MSIVTIVKAIIEALPTGLVLPAGKPNPVFYNSDDAEANTEDETLLPAVFLLGPVVCNDDPKQGGLIEESYPLKFFFARKSQQDWKQDQHQVIIDDMMELSRKFLVKCNASSDIRFIKNAKRTQVKNIFDVNLSGVYLEVNLTPFNTNPVC